MGTWKETDCGKDRTDHFVPMMGRTSEAVEGFVEMLICTRG